MGRADKGILGAISGKVGTVVGGSWRGKTYIRSVPTFKKFRKLSSAEKQQRAKFALAASFMRGLSQLIDTSFQTVKGQTPRNAAVSAMLTQAITGEYPNLVIDYSLVQVAKGSLKKAQSALADSTEPGKVDFHWNNDTGLGNAKATDHAILVAYDEETDSLVFSNSGFTRSMEEGELNVPLLSGKAVHTWIAFRSDNGLLISDSTYTGMVTVA